VNHLSKLATVILIRHVWNKIPPEILKYPNHHLHKNCKWVDEVNDEVLKIADTLINVLRRVSYGFGVGLAAPQLGYNKRMVAFKLPRKLRKIFQKKYVCMINPLIVDKKHKVRSMERCLSFKGLHFIKRYLWIKISFYDVSGNKHIIRLAGTPAIVMQQEVDHLNGVLVNDHKKKLLH
jgi:peptide deformylase